MHSLLHYKGGVDRKQRIVTHIVLVLLLFVELVLSVTLFLLQVQSLFSFVFVSFLRCRRRTFYLNWLCYIFRLIFFRTFPEVRILTMLGRLRIIGIILFDDRTYRLNDLGYFFDVVYHISRIRN